MDRSIAISAIAAVLAGTCVEAPSLGSKAGAAPASGYFESDELRLHYVDWGNAGATPLILLHHVNSQSRTWDKFARRMSGDYHVVALDMRGHGDSDWAGAGRYTTEDYASDVAGLVSHLELDPVVVLGGSTGGRVALVFAAMHPDRVAALIMEDVGAVRPPSIARNFSARLTTGAPEFHTVEEWADWLRGGNRRTPPDIFLHLAEHGTTRTERGTLRLKRDPALLADLRPLEHWNYVERVEAPFLMLLGSESTIVGEDQQTRFRAIRPDMEIITVDGAGHIVVHDKLDEFEREVREFLAGHRL